MYKGNLVLVNEKKQVGPYSQLLDPLTEKTYNVLRRSTTGYKNRFLNVNRLPFELMERLTLGYPLMLSNEQETILLTYFERYEAAANWQNVKCRIIDTPLKFVEIITEWKSTTASSPSATSK